MKWIMIMCLVATVATAQSGKLTTKDDKTYDIQIERFEKLRLKYKTGADTSLKNVPIEFIKVLVMDDSLKQLEAYSLNPKWVEKITSSRNYNLSKELVQANKTTILKQMENQKFNSENSPGFQLQKASSAAFGGAAVSLIGLSIGLVGSAAGVQEAAIAGGAISLLGSIISISAWGNVKRAGIILDQKGVGIQKKF